MFIYNIIPLTKIRNQENQCFFYYGKENLKIGTLVRINFRNRFINGIVLETKSLLEKKQELKKLDFQTKKIFAVISTEPILLDWQIKLAKWISRYYLYPLGGVFKLFIPKSLINKKKNINLIVEKENNTKNKINKINFIIDTKEKRWNEYLKIIAEKNEKILIIFPEIIQLEEFKKIIDKKNLSVICFSGNISTKKEFETWRKIRKNDFNLIIGTRSSLFLPFSKLDLIIIDEEENSSYKLWDMQPRYDSRKIIEKIAFFEKIDLIKGLEIPTLETYIQLKQSKGTELKKIKLPEINLIENQWNLLSAKVSDLLKENKDKNFIFFVNRHGLAPVVFCKDCGSSLVCPSCETNLILTKNTLFCRHCSFSKKIDTKCPKCGSWQLKTSGFGAEKIKKEIEKITGNEKIEIFDTLNLPTTKQQKEIIEKFKKGEIKYLIATPLILKFSITADFGIIVSAEQFLNFPEFQIYEKNIQRFFKFKKRVKNLFVQSRDIKNSFFEIWEKSELNKFYEQEINYRKKFSYPPFTDLIRFINFNEDEIHNKNTINEFIKNAENLFNKKQIDKNSYEFIGPNPCFIPKIKNRFCFDTILKVKKDSEKIKNQVFNLIPDSMKVDVDPKTLL